MDRVSLLIEQKRNLELVEKIPFEQRRYVCLANYVRGSGRERVLIEEMGLLHPMLLTQLPQREAIANAFDWEPEARTIEDKYGDGVEDVRGLAQELEPLVTLEQAA